MGTTFFRARLLALPLLALVHAALGPALTAARAGENDTPPLAVAHFDASALALFPFPPAGALNDVKLPRLPLCNLISFGPDAKSVYIRPVVGPGEVASVIKLEFGPTRMSVVPGSAGLAVAYLTPSQSGLVFASGEDTQAFTRGAYELNPETATRRPLRLIEGYEAPGAISPNGEEMLIRDVGLRPASSSGALSRDALEHLRLLNLKTGARQSLVDVTPGAGTGSWSPDGRWIAAASSERIVLIDARNPSHRRKLGSSGVDGRLIWSPDSKWLLFVKQELRCFLADDEETLEVVNVETGKRRAVPGGHCSVTSSALGWVDPEVVR